MIKSKWIFIIVLSMFLLISCKQDTENQVSITFETETPEVLVNPLTGFSGKIVNEPDVPFRDGYRFSHWELAGKRYTFSVYPKQSIVLKAVWTKTYRISFVAGDGHDVISPIDLLEGDALDGIPALSYRIDQNNNGYKFLFWTLDNEELHLDKMPNQDIELIAQWEEALFILFDTGDSSDVIEPLIKDAKAKITSPKEIPFLDNHLFIGWMYQGKPYIFDKMPNKSLKLVAEYKSLDESYYEESSLPKMFINLENNLLLDNVDLDNYVNSSITIHGISEEDTIIAVSSEFKGRGHGSWTGSGPKRGYRLKFFSKQGLFGEAASKHWVLLAGANFYDPTLAKNAIAFGMASNVFDYIEYTTSTNWVELYVNGEYRGIYLLAEHVRVEEARVNIESEYGVIDTGYLIEYDAYASEDGPEGIYYFTVPGYKHPIAIGRPDPEDFLDEGITEEVFRSQVAFIKNYVTVTLQAALAKDLTTFMEYADINSFIDMYLLHELFKNTDTGWSSFYMYKKPGGKLYAGPAWDFDATAGKSRGDSSYTGFYVSDSVTRYSDYTSSELYISLMQIPAFKTMVGQRWHEISSSVKAYINDFLSEEFIENNKDAFGQNYYRWSNLGPDYGDYPNLKHAINAWSSSVRELRNWLINRSKWFDIAF